MKKNYGKRQLFLSFAIFWIGLGWLGFVLAILGLFHGPILALYAIAGLSFLSIISFRNFKRLSFDKDSLSVLILAIIAISIFSYYSAPTIFSGRDQGSLSEAAIRLAENNELSFSFPAQQEFFKIYGPGPALNFPGFHYTASGELLTQFPLGYISWLATFYSFFGLSGFAIANGIAFLVFILSLYLIARNFLRPQTAVLSMVLIVTSFIFSWFFRFTLSENYALMLLWFGIFSFMVFTKSGERGYFLASLFTFILLVFTRIETLGFLAVMLLILYYRHRNLKEIFFRIIGKNALLAIAAIILLYFFYIFSHAQSLMVFLKNILQPFLSLSRGVNSYAEIDSISLFDPPIYTAKVLHSYALLNFVLFGLLGALHLLRKKKFEILIPFLIILPSFFYLIHPSISADHPWMLRRFLFSVIPASIIYALWFVDHFFKKKIFFNIFFALLLLSNLSVSLPYLSAVPNKDLLAETETLSRNFKETDLVLVDREASGDHWSMMSGPLNFRFGLQAVYFFNPQDLDKLDLGKFSGVYLIVPDQNLEFYADSGLLGRMTLVKDYRIENDMLEVAVGKKEHLYAQPIELPQMKKIITHGKIYQLNQE